MSALLARNWWAMALRGVFAILFGSATLLLPLATIQVLVLLFAAYMLVMAPSPSSPAYARRRGTSAGAC